MAKVKPPRRPKMFRDRNPVTTVTPTAAQKAFDKREEAKGHRSDADRVRAKRKASWRGIVAPHQLKAVDKERYLDDLKADWADQESNEALKDRETPRKVTATKKEMDLVRKIAEGSVEEHPQKRN
jgi:hypothetical protein